MPSFALAVLIVLSAGRAMAAFDDPATSARALAMGGAMTAVEGDAVSGFYNPAVLGSLNHAGLAGNFARQYNLQAGAADLSQSNAVGVAPLSGPGGSWGTAAISGTYEKLGNLSVDRSAGLGYGTYHLIETEDGSLDFGGRISLLTRLDQAGVSSGAKPDLDFGALYRFAERYAVGFSVLNANNPSLSVPGVSDKAPLSARLGISESVRDFTLSADLSHSERSGLYPNQTSAAFGFERWWTTEADGSFAARGGLLLGDQTQLASAGFGWKLFGGEWDYSLTLPLSGATRLGQAVSLVFRFGESHPDSEFERVLAAQIQDRRELAREFDAQLSTLTAREGELQGELAREKAEIDTLQRQLAAKVISEQDAQNRFKDLQQRYQKSQDDFDKIRRKARMTGEKSRGDRFKEDWAAYQKLKAGGAADAALISELKRILAEYKDSGVDLSDANRELLERLKGS